MQNFLPVNECSVFVAVVLIVTLLGCWIAIYQQKKKLKKTLREGQGFAIKKHAN
jgi:hypothetical protein